MKKILVTGAAGTVGLQVIRFLLSEGKYEITARDLKNKHNYKRLKHFKKRINNKFENMKEKKKLHCKKCGTKYNLKENIVHHKASNHQLKILYLQL